MSRKTTFLLAITTMMAFAACDKETNDIDNSPKSTWTFDGVTYKEGTNPTMFSSGSLSAFDNNLNGSISIQFGSRPGNGSYSITNLSDTAIYGGPSSSNCSIDLSTGSRDYQSSGGFVTVSVSAGKLTATFTNVNMEENSPPYTLKRVSGTLIER